jgi:catechol-2,3-dioxygenase
MSNLEESTARPKLHHINLKTTHLWEMVDWYVKVVGADVVFEFPGGAWLTNDEANHRIAFLSSPQMSDDPDKIIHRGMHHSGFEYGSIDDLLAAYARLKGEGIEPHATLDHGMTTSFYYVDPDGNSVELQHDNFGDWRKSREWMETSPQMAVNPIGVPVDPEKMIEARRARASAWEIHERAYAGEWPAEFDPRVPL